MARGVGGKKPPKTSKTSISATFSSPDASGSSIATPGVPPAPFKPAPAVLLPFANTLPKDHVFIVHVESTPPGMRKQNFLVPVILNLVISAGLCWRLLYAVPVYLEQISTIMGYDTQWTVQPKVLNWTDLAYLVLYRTFLLSIDYVIFGLFARWPWEFVFGDKYGRYTGACGWKWNVGFSRDKEPVVRRGRKWDTPIYKSGADRKKEGKPEKSWTKEEELAVHTKCSDGLRKTNTAKNALSLLDRDWDLDYRAMIDATELIDTAKISFPEIDHIVLVPWRGKWFVWYPHRVIGPSGSVQPVQERDEKLEAFKTKLIEIDCEDVFYRWIEIVQYETSQPTGFTEPKKQEAEQELRKMLQARSKDDAAFLKSVGGTAGIPGLASDN